MARPGQGAKGEPVSDRRALAIPRAGPHAKACDGNAEAMGTAGRRRVGGARHFVRRGNSVSDPIVGKAPRTLGYARQPRGHRVHPKSGRETACDVGKNVSAPVIL